VTVRCQLIGPTWRGEFWPGLELVLAWLEERLAVAAAEQEREPVQVVAQLAGALGVAADETGQRCAEEIVVGG
jgi:hypothetical protein